MGFKLLETVAFSTIRASTGSISYTRGPAKGKKLRPKLIVSIPSGLVAQANVRGLKAETADKMHFAFMLGDGANAGVARITFVGEGGGSGVTARFFKGSLVFRFGYVPLLGDDAAAREDLEGITPLVGQGWEFVLPAWFKKDEKPVSLDEMRDTRGTKTKGVA
jgi:hypothetical protein